MYSAAAQVGIDYFRFTSCWVELGWAGLGWVGLGWVGLGWAVLCRVCCVVVCVVSCIVLRRSITTADDVK